jgi:hypothetical protein
MISRTAVLVSIFVAASVSWGQAPSVFTDVTASTGIDFVQRSSPEKKYIVESMAGGVALLDFDNDGKLDIYFVNSCTVDNYTDPKCARSALYRNLGEWKFADVSDVMGVAYPGWGMGVCVGDADGDGYDDLYVTGLGSNRFYRNVAGKRFEDVTEASKLSGGGWSTGCGFADYDDDGDLDLFVSRYVKVDLSDLPEFGKGKSCQYRGIAVQCGPRGLPGSGDLLFRNNGDGTFTEVAKEAGVDDSKGYFGLGIAWFDYNNDHRIDLFVANDSNANLFYKNLGNGKFAEVGFPVGLALSEDGSEQGCMGVALADYNGDGRLDLYVTNFSEEYNALYRQEKDGNYSDTSFPSKSAPSSLPYVGWGTAFFDYDNDGWLDLLAVNGHVYPQMETANVGASAKYRQRKLLYRNLGDGTFAETTASAGPALMLSRVSRGAAFGDIDNDGDVDVVINDLDGPPMVLRNDIRTQNRWLQVMLEGSGKNRRAIGATVRITAGGHQQAQVVRSGTSYLSQDDFRLHFGLGRSADVDVIEVTWPDGTVTRRTAVAANQLLKIEQAKRP